MVLQEKKKMSSMKETCLEGTKRCPLTLNLKPFKAKVRVKHSAGKEFDSLAIRGKKLWS